ncbi:MAG: hypothetical protein A3K76_06785 [Euryarchaeota archaeon RBG_13_57_23]|nr:MAG: hypothetical protein A3K76_06785 [Euryarchaeota archaeon RBG_13_57_23]
MTDSDTPQRGHSTGDRSVSIESQFRVLEAISKKAIVLTKDLLIVYMNAPMRVEYAGLLGTKCTDGPLSSPVICTQCPIKGDWDYSKGPLVKCIPDEHGRMIESSTMKYLDPVTGEPYWVCVEEDVTERLDTETRLKMLASSIDQMAEAVVVTDVEGKRIYVNKAYVHLTGYDEKASSGLSLSDHSRDGSSSGTLTAIMRTASYDGWQGEMTGLRKDGSRYYTQVDAKPVKDARGTTIGVVGILRDVTKLKTEKVQIEEYTSELEAKMEERTAELAKKVSQLTTINKISRVVTSLLNQDELINEFVKAIAQGFGYRNVIFMMMDRERGDMFMKACYGRALDSIPKDLRQKLKEGIIGHAAYFGETLVSGNVDSDPRYVRKGLIGTKSELSVPVTYRGEILGVLDVQSEFNDAFTRNDVILMEMLADMLATSLVNARTYSESKEREAALSVLDRISKQISYRLEPGVILDQVARDASALLKAEKSMVGLLDQHTNTINFVSTYKIDKALLKDRVFPAADGVTGRALRSLKTEVVNDYVSDPDAIEHDAVSFNIRSLMSAPMTIEGRGIGAINVYNKLNGKVFTKSDMLFLSSLADHAAIALENSNLLASLNQRVHSQLALLETTISIQKQIDSTSIYDAVADKLREVVWYDGITFYKVDSDRKMIVPLASRGPFSAEIMAEEFSVEIGITGYVARTGKAELINDTGLDSRAVTVAGTTEDREAMMAIPLGSKEKMSGVLVLYRDRGTRFSDSEFEIAQLFATQAAVAIENAELYRTREQLLKDSRRKVDQMAKLVELTTSVMYMDDLDRLLQRIADITTQSFGFRRSLLAVYDADQDVFTITGQSGYPSWFGNKLERPGTRITEDMEDEYRISPAGYYIPYENQRYGIEEFFFLAHPELANKPRESPESWHERDILIFALKDRSGRLSGFMELDEPIDLKVPKPEQLEVMEILAAIASIAIENSRTFEKQVMAANEVALLNDLMTHDINNFNQGIMGYIELLLEDRRLDDNQRRYAERALVQVRNNAHLIDNIRKLSKIRMIADAELMVTDLQKVIVEAIEVVTKANPEKKVNIVSTLSQNTHFVMGSQYVVDLFVNILSNSVKFDQSRRVRVDVHVADETFPQGTFWIVSVIDRGRGIPDDRKKAVFERFATGITGVKGFGLGLSIVSSIVSKYGGRIWVEDRVPGDFSKGTVFKVSLPKAELQAEAALLSPPETRE